MSLFTWPGFYVKQISQTSNRNCRLFGISHNELARGAVHLTFSHNQCHGGHQTSSGRGTVHLDDVNRDVERHRVGAVPHGQFDDVSETLGAVMNIVELILTNFLQCELVTWDIQRSARVTQRTRLLSVINNLW